MLFRSINELNLVLPYFQCFPNYLILEGFYNSDIYAVIRLRNAKKSWLGGDIENKEKGILQSGS